MNTTKYEIELPTLPDGHDRVEYRRPKEGDLFLRTTGEWTAVAQFDFEVDHHFVAIPIETLAGWANKQRLFQALAEMRAQMGSTVISHHIGKAWDWGGSLMVIAEPPANLTGKLRLEVGKWVDVS